MARYVAFLRGINVGGYGLLGMDDLRRAFEDAGCRNVRTYIASGNVIFDCPARGATSIERKVKRELAPLLDREPEIMVRSTSELERAIARAPFSGRDANDRTKLYVIFLGQAPRRRPRLPLVNAKERLEAVAISDGEAYLISRRKPNGWFGFPNEFIERALDVRATSRTWSTVTKILAMARQVD